VGCAGIKNPHHNYHQSATQTLDNWFFSKASHRSGLIRLPDVPSSERVIIIKDLIDRFQKELKSQAIITVRGGKIRISASPE
jgi:hypothetical protein